MIILIVFTICMYSMYVLSFHYFYHYFKHLSSSLLLTTFFTFSPLAFFASIAFLITISTIVFSPLNMPYSQPQHPIHHPNVQHFFYPCHLQRPNHQHHVCPLQPPPPPPHHSLRRTQADYISPSPPSEEQKLIT